jgi:hypothetical protein
MPDQHNIQPHSSQPMVYQIRIKGHLGSEWTDWFEGLSIMPEEDGDTLLIGPVVDQAALHGLFKKVRDLGMTLVSVNRVQFDVTHPCRSKKGETMNISTTPKKNIDTKVLLSTLWIVVMINMLKADILSLFIPGATDEVAKTAASAGASIPQLMLGAAIIGQLAIAMIVLSRVLKYGINRWVNIVVGIIIIAYIWGGMASYPHYLFISSVETLCLLLIVWFAWKWRSVED